MRFVRYILFVLWCIGLFVLVLESSFAQIDNELCGTLTSDTTLEAHTTYIVLCSVTVPENVTLTVEEGAEIVYAGADSGYYFVHGILDVNGTSQNPVKFTALTPLPGSWGALTATDTGEMFLDYVIVEYGGRPQNAQIQVLDGELVLNNSTVQFGSYGGILTVNGSAEIRSSTISNNADFGLRVIGHPGNPIEPIVKNNRFDNNGTYASHFIFNGGGMGNGIIKGNTGSGNGVLNGVFIEGFFTDSISRLSPNPDFPYLVWTITIDPNKTLTIEPGVVLKFLEPPDAYAGTPPFPVRGTGTMIVHGNLVAQGTPSEPIVMTSFWDDTVGGDTDGSTETAQPGDWRGITMRDGALVDLNYVDVLYGGANSGANIDTGSGQADTATVVMRNSAVRFSGGNGVSGKGIFDIAHSDITDNQIRGIGSGGTGNLSTLFNSTIEGNLAQGLWHYGTGSLDATNNYWGSANGPTSCGGQGEGDIVCGSVQTVPFYGVPLAITVQSVDANTISLIFYLPLALILSMLTVKVCLWNNKNGMS